MKVWKVLTQDRKSVAVYDELQVHYPVGQTVVAPVGGLLAFATKEQANRFRNTQLGVFLVVKAVGIEPIRLPIFRLDTPANKREAGALWRGDWKMSNAGARYLYGWPKGTVAFRKIRCLT